MHTNLQPDTADASARATRETPEPRKITGWAAADMTLSPATLNAMARNPHIAFPVSGDAKPRPAWMVLGHNERQALLNMGPKPKGAAA